jgi:two-component system response regulator HydG
LLRVLQDRQITRLGSNEPIQVDVRFVSATNKNLEEAIAKREFRDDLYFRIKGAAISLAPLRQRREDIPLLIKHLMEKIAKREGKPLQHLSNEARDLLVAHDWPGNVRQLENVIESMTALSTGSTLTLDDIPPDILGQFSVKSVTSTALAPIDRNASTQSLALPNLAGVSLAELEREAIEKTLQLVQGNREQAAKMLGIGERTLYRKIKEYDIVE